jgi:HD-GYP domain-containing protein (c-di-GMP phosphodiesterase class II)
MERLQNKEKLFLEILLVLVCLGLASLLFIIEGYKMVILNLFFLPIALEGLFLGRHRAGVMALLSVVATSAVLTLQLGAFAVAVPPLVIILAVTVWGAALGLTAMLIGSLSDDRLTKIQELHEAYVGVVEVLSQYLQSAHPRLQARAIRIAELSQEMAEAMELTPRETDDIRVAALLYDVGNIEITTRVIRRAANMFEEDAGPGGPHTFRGMDLMLSLSAVLRGAIPLLLNQDREKTLAQVGTKAPDLADCPAGAKIIRLARAYFEAACPVPGKPPSSRTQILKQLRADTASHHDPYLLDVLEKVTSQRHEAESPELEGAAAS